MPLILVVLLAIGALGVLLEELHETADHQDAGHFGVRSLVLIGLTVGFVWAFEPLGYWIATVAYTFCVAWLFEQERVGASRAAQTALLIAAGITVMGWLFFVQLFELFLPEGYF